MAEGDESPRQLQALRYIDTVKDTFAERPIMYYKFLDLLKEFRSQKRDTVSMMQEVSTLFKGNTGLILGFNSFLPAGYQIYIKNGAPSIQIPSVEIVEADDPRVEVYRAVKERDLAQSRGDVFLLEGENSISNLVRYGRIPLVSLCISEKRISAMRQLIDVVAAKGVPVYALPQKSLEALVGFNFHRGVLGCGRKLPSTHPSIFMQDLKEEHHGPIILCEKMNNLDNLGALFRNAACFGAQAILFDDQCSDPYYRKSLRVSGGHALAIPFNRFDSIQNIITAVKAHGFFVIALVTPHTPCQPQSIVDWQPPPCPKKNLPLKVALLLGAEGPGLSVQAQALADACLTIPMAPNVDSLNVATTAAVALHEITTKHLRSSSPHPASRSRRRRATPHSSTTRTLLSLVATTTLFSSVIYMLGRTKSLSSSSSIKHIIH